MARKAALHLTELVFLGAFTVLSHHPRAYARSRPLKAAPEFQPSSSGTSSKPAPEAASGVNLHDADSLLQTAIPRTLRNRRAAMAFTYGIDYRNRNFTPRGKLITDYSAKYEVIFVEGLPYRRQTEENRKPLTGQAAAAEQRRYDQTFTERSQMTIDQKRAYLKRRWNVDVPLPQILSLFSNSVVGEEMVDGRRAIVVESTPLVGAHPADEEEIRALHKQVKLWIDREDLIASRIEATLIDDDAEMKKGTVARIDFVKKDGVWLPSQSDVEFQAVNDSEIVRGETREINEDFHRFHVDVRLLDPGETATGASPAQ